ncbi:MAG: hypothetical protein ACPHVN_00780 [Luminiphilus sp.]
MADAFVFAFAAAGALFILLLKMNLRRVLGYDVFVDIICTVVLVTSFSGTLTGMAAAMIAGVAISILLGIAKLLIGYERIERRGLKLTWVTYPPKMRIKL